MPAKTLRPFGGILCCLLWAMTASAETIHITSEPPGASVEIDGVFEGKTPYEMKVPSAYFKGPNRFRKALGTPMYVRISMEGYVTQELELTRGPISYVKYEGLYAYRSEYYVLKTDHFHFSLEKTAEKLTGSVVLAGAGSVPAKMSPDLSPEKIADVAGPSVVLLKCPEWSGTGFFLTETGVIATNAHVARGLRTMTAVDSSGKKRDATVVYVDDKMDLALLKAEGAEDERFPHLTLAATSDVHAGQSVIAIGNPGGGMPNTVTKGVVSGIGPLKSEPGTWIQTDAAINHGNSGGPLLNTQAEVIGLNTMGHRGKDMSVQGINFALSADDLTHMLARFYPQVSATTENGGSTHESTGRLDIESSPGDADIYVDDKFIGMTPSTLTLATGSHTIRLASKGFKDWGKDVEVLKDSRARLKITLEPLEP